MIKIRFVLWYSVTADCEMHDSISHQLTQCHANSRVHVARQRLRTVNVRSKFFSIQHKVLKMLYSHVM